MIFWLFTAAMVGFVGSRVGAEGRAGAFWSAWWVALLVCPFWISIQPGVLTVDVRAVGMVVALVAMVLSPGPGGIGFGKPVLVDGLMAVMISAFLVSEYKMGRWSPLMPLEIMRVWLLPYVVGRLFLRSTDDIPEATRRFAKVAAYATIYAMVEAVTKINPINKALGKTWGILEAGEGYRMGMKRAQGAQEHPIFMGLILLLILPWAFEAAKMARASRGPGWWKALPWMVGGALFGTVSRGPQGSGLMLTYVAIFLRSPKHRAKMAVLGVGIGLAIFAGKAILMELSAKISKEDEEPIRIIVIDGDEEEYTGTRHRVLLFKAYRDYLDTAGLWGFGNGMKLVQLEEKLAERFSSIDSAYVMLFLQRGYSGVVPFVAVSVVTLLNLLWVAWPARRPHAALAAGMFGAILLLVLTLFTSWFSPDFGSAFLFTVGIAARFPSLRPAPGSRAVPAASATPAIAGPAPTPPAVAPLFALVPGHPPRRRVGDR